MRVGSAIDHLRERRVWEQLDAYAIVPAIVAFAALIFLALKQGGYTATSWYPAGLFLLLLFGAVVFGTGGAWPRLSRWQMIAVGSLAAFAVWSLLSISWAEVKGDAWDGANRALLYCAVFTLFAILPWRERSGLLLLGLFAAGTALLGLGVLIHTATTGNPQPDFIGTRLSSPTGYQNATAELFMAAVWPSVLLAARREVPIVVRALMFAAAGLLVDLAILAQSRGWLYAAPVAAVLYVLLVPRRIRSVLALGVLCGAALLAWPHLSKVYDANGAAGLHHTMHGALRPIGLACLVLFVAGIAWGVVDARLRLPARFELAAARALGGAAAVAVLAIVVVAFTSLGLGHRLSRSWHQFRTEVPNYRASSHFSSGLGGGRYDFWRVAFREFEAHPVQGVGADNFARDYVRLRRVGEEPQYPHSLELGVLAGTGAIGAVLFLGFLVGALGAAHRAWRHAGADSLGRAAVAGSVATFGYWLVHDSVDWFWAFPALTAPAFALLGLAGAVGRPVAETSAAPTRIRRAGLVVGVALGIFAAVSFVPPWLAARDVAIASGTWRTDTAGALNKLNQARELNFLSNQPDLVAGAIASRTGQWEVARTRFDDALARTPGSWLPYLELGVLDALQGRKRDAVQDLARVRELNPLESTTAVVLRRMREGRPLTFAELNQIFVNRVHERLS